MSLHGGERWFVVRSLPHQEARADANLVRQGFRTFLPRMARTIRHARTLRDVKSPVFPGYLFLALDLERDRWRSVNGTRGVATLIMGKETPKPVPPGVVEELLEQLSEDGLLRFGDELIEGQPVRILSGPFASAIGCLERLDPSGRVRVLLDIMGGKVPAKLDRSVLEAI